MNVQPRLSVKYFGIEQEKKLQEKEYKGGWENLELLDLMYLLEGEVNELNQAIYLYERAVYENSKFLNQLAREVVRESADCGNYAMMIADRIMDKTRDRGTKPKYYNPECSRCECGRET